MRNGVTSTAGGAKASLLNDGSPWILSGRKAAKRGSHGCNAMARAYDGTCHTCGSPHDSKGL